MKILLMLTLLITVGACTSRRASEADLWKVVKYTERSSASTVGANPQENR